MFISCYQFHLLVAEAPSSGDLREMGFLMMYRKIPPFARGLRSSGLKSNNSI